MSPQALQRPCARPGCHNLVDSGLCDDCARERERQRGSAHARGYTRRWEKYRLWFLHRNPFCGDRLPGTAATMDSRCAVEQRVTIARVVDHIVPHRGDQRLFWERTNHQSLCKDCHDAKTRSGR